MATMAVESRTSCGLAGCFWLNLENPFGKRANLLQPH